MSVNYREHTDLAPSDPHYQELANQFPKTEAKLRIMDLGSGLGYALDGILARVPNAQVTCLDISSEMLRGLTARLSRYGSQIGTRKESYVTADLGENCFDCIISSFTMHHLPKAAKLSVFRKIFSALDDQGRYIELDGVASAEQEARLKTGYDRYVAQRDSAEGGEWNYDLLMSIATERALLLQAGFSCVTVAWTDIDEQGTGRAIFVAEKQ